MARLTFYNAFKKNQFDGTANIDFDTDTIKISLHTSSYTPDVDTHDFFDDVTNEVSSTGYTAGGGTLANADITLDTTNDRSKFDANDFTWNNVTLTFRYAVLYKSTGTASTSPLVGYIDFESNRSVAAGDLQISFHSDGIFLVS